MPAKSIPRRPHMVKLAITDSVICNCQPWLYGEGKQTSAIRVTMMPNWLLTARVFRSRDTLYRKAHIYATTRRKVSLMLIGSNWKSYSWLRRFDPESG